MNAHIVPVVYLKEFAIPSKKKKSRSKEIYQITNQGLSRECPRLNDVCCAPDYYSNESAVDKLLFREQENYFGSLITNLESRTLNPNELSRMLWVLFARNRTIHENARYRVELAKASHNINFTNREYTLLTIDSPNNLLITSDNPVLLMNSVGGDPKDLLMIVPITPTKLLVSYSKERVTPNNKDIRSVDVNLLNHKQAENCYEYVLTGIKPSHQEIESLKKLINPKNITCRSEAIIFGPNPHAIINFSTEIYRMDRNPYSFLEIIA